MNDKSSIRQKMTDLRIDPELMQTVKTVAVYAGAFISGFVMSLGKIFSVLSPFGVALSLSLPFTYMPAAAGGAILGYAITESGENSVRYAAAVIIGAIILVTLQKTLSKTLKDFTVAVIICISTAATGIAVAIGFSADAYSMILTVAEGVCAGCFSLFFRGSMRLRAELRDRRILKTSELICLLMTLAAVLLCLSGFALYEISPARIAAVFLILTLAKAGRETTGAVAGTCLGALLGFSDGFVLLSGGYSLGGLLAGIAGKTGKFAASVAFILGNSLIFLFSGETEKLLPAIVESGVGALIFLLLPKKATEFFESFFIRPGCDPDSDNLRNLLTFKLHAASSTVYDVSGSVKAVSLALAGMNKKNETTVYNEVRDEICKNCSRMTNCWEYNFENTLDAFNRMTLSRKNGEIPDRDNLPPYFSSRCVCIEALTESFNRCYMQREWRQATENKLSEIRAVAADQFTSISVMLENLAEELQRDIIFAPETAEKAAQAVEGLGIHVRDALCVINEGGYAVLQIYCTPVRKKISASHMAQVISEHTGLDFDPPVVGEGDKDKIMLLFCEKPPCAVKAAVSQYTGEGQSVTGDAYDFFNDGRGHFIMILSDGMGTGSRAAIDGKMTTGLAGKLIRAGFSFECVVKTVNSALMVKSKDESLSTLDIISVDLFAGEATFYKAGAAASLICRRGKTIRIERSSLPLGILRDVEFERVTGKIGNGDLLVMMSDGATAIPPDLLRRELSENFDRPVQEIASSIAALAKSESSPGKADDITVIAAVVHKR